MWYECVSITIILWSFAFDCVRQKNWIYADVMIAYIMNTTNILMKICYPKLWSWKLTKSSHGSQSKVLKLYLHPYTYMLTCEKHTNDCIFIFPFEIKSILRVGRETRKMKYRKKNILREKEAISPQGPWKFKFYLKNTISFSFSITIKMNKLKYVK